MLHRPPGFNTDKFEDREVTEAKLDNNEVCMCVISVVICSCIHYTLVAHNNKHNYA